ncbi:hypothetical protein AB0C77_12745 [Streptomyces sp. NPDC048629]|uniref:hypothetical protein n=1 Tax=Streptomyces sp. NPDC048629 TaxID=3154824 RepID=UPI00341B53B3
MAAQQDRRTASWLFGGAVACAVLAVAVDVAELMFVVSGMLVGALMVYRRTVEQRPYAYWVAWLAGSVIGLLLAWPAGPSVRGIVLAIAGAEALVALVLFLLWLPGRARPADGR